MSLYELAVALFTAVTAIATSAGAYLAWRNHEGRVRIEYYLEWSRTIHGDLNARIRITVRNETRNAFEIGSVEIKQPPMKSFGEAAKHESWGPQKSPLKIRDVLEPGKSHAEWLDYSPDWVSWADSLERSPRYRLLRLFRRRYVPAYSIIILYARDVSSISRLKRHTQKVMVHADRVIKQAEAARSQT